MTTEETPEMFYTLDFSNIALGGMIVPAIDLILMGAYFIINFKNRMGQIPVALEIMLGAGERLRLVPVVDKGRRLMIKGYGDAISGLAAMGAGETLMLIKDIAELTMNTAVLCYLLYIFCYNLENDLWTCQFLNYITLTFAFRTMFVYALMALEGIYNNIRKNNFDRRLNEFLLYVISCSLCFVVLINGVGPVMIDKCYDCCGQADCYILFSKGTVSYWFWTAHVTVLAVLYADIKLIDYRHVMGGNYKTPAEYNKERDFAERNFINFSIFIVGWALHFYFYFLREKTQYTLCISAFFPALRPYMQHIIRLIWDGEFRKASKTFFHVVFCNKKPVVSHERHRRRNHMRQERADRCLQCKLLFKRQTVSNAKVTMLFLRETQTQSRRYCVCKNTLEARMAAAAAAAFDIGMQDIKPQAPVDCFDRNDAVTWV